MNPVRNVLLPAVAATALFFCLTLPVDFPFMADDYNHLAAAYDAESFVERFARWLNRVPVWSFVMWVLFGSRVLEQTWAPMYLFFFCHTLGLAATAKWLDQRLLETGADVETPSRTALFVGTICALALYPSTYEILYWPTCMPYAVGAALLGLGLWVNRFAVRVVLLALSFLTLETFILPALVLLAAPVVLRDSQGRREWLHPVKVWAAALIATLAVRWAVSLSLGPYHHIMNFDPAHMTDKMADAFRELFHVRFFAADTNEIATAAQFGLVIVLTCLAWKRVRWNSLWMLALCFVSTATYWVLAYPAPRAVYGSQVLFLAIVAWLGLRAAREGWARRVVAFGLAVLLAGYLYQLFFIYEIKSHNAQVLREREAVLAARMGTCAEPCVVEVGALDEGLREDWVLHPDYWTQYLIYVKARHGAGKEITFEVRRD